MARLRCPKCGTVVEQFGATAPTCPECGFGSDGSRTPEQAGFDLNMVRRAGFDATTERGAVGKPRSFQATFVPNLLTTPVPGLFPNLRAFRELDVQADRQPSVGWGVGAILGWGLALASFATALLMSLKLVGGNNAVQLGFLIAGASFLGLAQLMHVVHVGLGLERLKQDRAAYGIEGGLRPWLVYVTMTVGALTLIGPFVAADHVRRNINRVQASIWRSYGKRLPKWADIAYPPEPTPAVPEPDAETSSEGSDDEYGAITLPGEEAEAAIEL